MKNDRNLLAFVWIVLGIGGRMLSLLIPNINPMTSLSLFGGAQLSRTKAFVLTFLTMLISDAMISKIHGVPMFGFWSLFTYSGFAAILFAGSRLGKTANAGRTLGFLTASSFGFWLWTNFGIWATGDHGMYARSLQGLVACYTNALPFLGYSLAGDLAWGFVFFASLQGVRKLAPRLGWSVQGA